MVPHVPIQEGRRVPIKRYWHPLVFVGGVQLLHEEIMTALYRGGRTDILRSGLVLRLLHDLMDRRVLLAVPATEPTQLQLSPLLLRNP